MAANGTLRAVGLLAKFFASPSWAAAVDAGGGRDPTFLLVISVLSCCCLLDLYRRPAILGTFGLLLTLKTLRSALNGQGTLVDVTLLRTVDGKVNVGGYGSQRLWGSLAWGCGSYVIGHLIDVWGFDVIFYWTYFFSALLLVLVYLKPRSLADRIRRGNQLSSHGSSQVEDEETCQGKNSNLRSTKSSTAEVLTSFLRIVAGTGGPVSYRSFLLMVLQLGFSLSLVEHFMLVQLKKEFGCSTSFMGQLTLVGVVTQLPLFYFSTQLIKAFGHTKLFFATHIVLWFRLLVMATLITKDNYDPLLLYLQISHGPCFALAWVTAVDFSSFSAPPELRATAQGVLGTTYHVVGPGLGTVLWSAVYEATGAQSAYALGSLSVLLGGAALLPRLQGRQQETLGPIDTARREVALTYQHKPQTTLTGGGMAHQIDDMAPFLGKKARSPPTATGRGGGW